MDILMPQLGETVAEGKILTWFKKVGDEVKEGARPLAAKPQVLSRVPHVSPSVGMDCRYEES